MIQKKNIIIALLILLAGVGTLILLIFLKKPVPRKPENPKRAITVRDISRKMIVPEVKGYAFVKSSSIIQLRSQVAGKVIYASKATKNGSIVNKDEVLLKIEPDDYIIARDQADASLSILKAEKGKLVQTVKDLEEMSKAIKSDYDLEQENYNRILRLYKQNVVSLAEKDRASQALSRRQKLYIEISNKLTNAKFALQENIASIKKAESNLRQAELNLSRCVIKSPIAGRVVGCDIDEGEYLNTGQDVCIIKNDMDPELSVPLDVHSVSGILGIMPDKKRWFAIPEKMKITIAWDEEPDICKWEGEITRIQKYSPETDTVSLLVKPVSYCGKGEKHYPLLPGMFCTVTFFGEPRQGFSVPFSSLQVGNKIYTVNSKGVLKSHKVKPFLVEDDTLLLLDGLPDKCTIVSRQLPRGIINGMTIKPVYETATEASSHKSAAGTEKRDKEAHKK